jgi:hypothetical protein
MGSSFEIKGLYLYAWLGGSSCTLTYHHTDVIKV